MKSILYLGLSLCVISFYNCKQNTAPFKYTINKSLDSDSAMVISAHPLASEVGVKILKQGGNAIDATIAVHFALAVCYPGAGNLGGGGFIVYRSNDGKVSTLDYREKAPSKASKDMYLDKAGNVINDLSTLGHLACGVPGSVAGMQEAFTKYSKLKDWAMLVQPAIDIAANGMILTASEANNLNEDSPIFQKVNGRVTTFNSQVWKEGDNLKQPELAHTLTLIRDKGADGFYKGEVAKMLVDEVKSGGGIMSLEDLANYRPIWRTPINTTYRGYKIYSMPPPSSGGIALTQLLKSVEPYNVKEMGHNTVATTHLMVEAERRVYADRAKYLGDADFFKVPQTQLMDSNYIARRMKSFDKMKATKSSEIKEGSFKESEHTTHFSIVDKYGNAVSSTTTLNGGYGCYVVVDGAGFILNNEMDDFSVKPGTPNVYGLVGAKANKIEPNKRMLSSMTPTILEKNGKLFMVVGTPGGSTIITSVFQTILNVIDHNMTASDAVQAPRFHHQWQPDHISSEMNCFTAEATQQLTSMGHKFSEREQIGRVENIVVNQNSKLSGGADRRGNDDAKGF
jgi:gamma-glutamyltranspeptidase / glutathione hydrolase